jgi:hypothetical protein
VIAMTDTTFDALPPLPTDIVIAGQTVELSPLRVGELPGFMRVLRPLGHAIGPDLDWLTVFGERGESS